MNYIPNSSVKKSIAFLELEEEVNHVKTEVIVLKEKIEWYEKRFEKLLQAVNKFVEILEESGK